MAPPQWFGRAAICSMLTASTPPTCSGLYPAARFFIGHELPVKVQRIDPPPPFGGEKLVLSKMLNEGELHGAVVPGDNGYTGFFGGGETPPMMAAYPGVKPLFDNNQEILDYVKK